jgi:hypothetical protein
MGLGKSLDGCLFGARQIAIMGQWDISFKRG